ncbi:MAG: hypothetical protein MRZ22_04340 [Oscillospiraceae bacterium]|nr:hypothetical protein [Oscillospiraceae bacterium]
MKFFLNCSLSTSVMSLHFKNASVMLSSLSASEFESDEIAFTSAENASEFVSGTRSPER